MNPKLVKFVVELQNEEKVEKTEKSINFKNGEKRFFNFFKFAKVTVPIDRN